MFPDTTPKLRDSDNNLLFKIAQGVAGMVGGSAPLVVTTGAAPLVVTTGVDPFVVTLSGVASMAVSGGVADNAPETEDPVLVAGKAVTTATYLPNYTDGDRATFAIDKATGGVLAHTRQLALLTDFVSVAGDIVHDVADNNRPVSIGGRAIASEAGPTAVASGDRVNAWFDTIGRAVVKVGGKDIYAAFSSAARTTTQTGASFTQSQMKGLLIWLKVTAVSGAASITVSVEGSNPVDGSFTPAFTFSPVIAVGTTLFKVYPGITVAAGLSFSDVVPRTFRIVVTHGTADSITYSVGFETEI